MASPVADSYSAASGAGIYGGRYNLPDWVPASGCIKSVHLNDLTSVNPCPTNDCWYSESAKQNGPWANWNGAVFSPDFSDYGAMVFWGGGHGGYSGTEYYIFDLSTRQWSRIGEQYPEGVTADTTWYDTLVNGSRVVAALHTYCHPVYISPSQGGGSKGSWMMGYNVGGEGSNLQPHAVDLATGVSTRFTSAPGDIYLSGGPYCGAFVDTNRDVVWLIPGQESNQNAKIDLTQNPRSVDVVTSFYAPGYYACPVFVPDEDMMIAAWVSGGNIALGGYDLATGVPVGFSITQAATEAINTSTNGVGMDWCPHTGKFYIYEGAGDDSVHVLTPPDNWKTGTWEWASESMLGETPVAIAEVITSPQGAQPFTKWKYNPSLRSFMWSQGTVSRQCTDGTTRAGAFQIWRPEGS